jgi:hypothetical protein
MIYAAELLMSLLVAVSHKHLNPMFNATGTRMKTAELLMSLLVAVSHKHLNPMFNATGTRMKTVKVTERRRLVDVFTCIE